LKKIINVLLVTPDFTRAGGVTEFNKLLLRYSSRSNIIVFSMRSGASKSLLGKIVMIFVDYFRYLHILLTKNLDVIHVGPSLNKKSLKRDSIYVLLAKWFNKAVFVHWHGWNPACENLLDQKLFLRHTLFRADHIKLLSTRFEKKIITAGFINTTTLGTTFVDDTLLDFDISKLVRDDFNILFLSTLSINKGIYTILDAFTIACAKIENICLTIAGTGEELRRAQQYVQRNGIKKVKFIGHVEQLEKAEAFINADLYVFPSQYEGMPTSVLEAMAFGLPILCNRVGALTDFFKDGCMGMALDSGTAKDFAYYINHFAKNRKLCHEIGVFNRTYARQRFLASNGVERIERDYLDLTSHKITSDAFRK